MKPGSGTAEARRRAGAPVERDPGTLVGLLLDGVERHGEKTARLRRLPGGGWETLTYAEVGERVRALTLGLRSLGIGRGDRVALLSETRLEWALADFALVMAGAVSVPVYPSLSPGQMAHVLADAGARAVFVDGPESLASIREISDGLPMLERLFVFEADEEGGDPPAEPLEALARRGRAWSPPSGEGFESFARRSTPDELATLIYTSGTTGPPKGVMLSHDNLYSNVEMSARVLPAGEGDTALSWLPLSHVFERMAGHYLMWYAGVPVAFADSVGTVVRDMAEVRPTIMTAVPRLYEKLLEGAEAAAREKGDLALGVFRWARRVGEERADRRLEGRRVGPWLALRHRLADRLVFARLRDRTGGHIRHFVSGGAALPVPVARFLWAAGLPVLEGYGLTEASPVLAVNPPDAPRLGTVGPPIAGTEIRIAGDGEILARGPQVMLGYYGRKEATREVLEGDGWLHTGDIGTLDADGYLRITDRKKELIVTSQGKNIAPAPVETLIQRSRFVDYAVLIGDGRKFVIVVVQPAFEEIRAWSRKKGRDAEEAGQMIRDPRIQRRIAEEVRELTGDVAPYERPGWMLLVEDRFGVESGELTPTMKIKRRVIAERYGADIDAVYRLAETMADAVGGEIEVAVAGEVAAPESPAAASDAGGSDG